MHTFAVPVLGVVIAAVTATVVGILWYSPYVFGSMWLNLSGVDRLDIRDSRKKVMKAYFLCFVSAIISSYILAVVLENLLLKNVADAAVVSFFLWLGFVATSLFVEFLFEVRQKPWKLYSINAGYQLISLMAGASILYLFN